LNWWNIAKQKDTDHPTEKVIGVPEMAIAFSSNAGQIVFDGFLGSGTTLIACERLGRKCRAVEISPAYCAVAIQRWVDVTGGEPEVVQ
jgi:DNA modification methylase